MQVSLAQSSGRMPPESKAPHVSIPRCSLNKKICGLSSLVFSWSTALGISRVRASYTQKNVVEGLRNPKKRKGLGKLPIEPHAYAKKTKGKQAVAGLIEELSLEAVEAVHAALTLGCRAAQLE